MSFDPDRLFDRRRLKRGIVLWRTLAVFALFGLVVVAIVRFGPGFGGDHVARLWINGLIVDDPERDAAIAAIRDDPDAKAVLLRIDSPGGTAAGGEALYVSLRALAAEKPMVAVMGTSATSAAYMTALAADHIVARAASLTGAIGVLFQTAEFTELLDEIGVRTEAIRSGPLKAQPSPLERLTPQARAATQALVADTYELFIEFLMERRALDRTVALTLADGRVYTGRQALAAGLIDSLGGESEALRWLVDARGVPGDLPIRDAWNLREEGLIGALRGVAKGLIPSESLALDGLIAVWHPASSN